MRKIVRRLNSSTVLNGNIKAFTDAFRISHVQRTQECYLNVAKDVLKFPKFAVKMPVW